MNLSQKHNLKLDWATHEAAKYACENWHYSKCMPAGKIVKIGAWENDKFIGVILYSRGATPHIGSPYNLDQTKVCELTRIAMNKHITPISKMIAISLRLLKKKCSGLKLVVSYADADQNHLGGIYKATNWIYEGKFNEGQRGAFVIKGKKVHPRSVGARGGVQSLVWIKKNLDKNATEFITKGKYKYLMPLDGEMRKKLKHLSKPYPKCVSSADSGTLGFQPRGGGATPTDTLHFQNAK